MKNLLSKLFGASKKTSKPSLKQRNQARLQVEGLESRQLMSASPIAAPIAKPILAPALSAQPATFTSTAKVQVQHQASARQSVAYSPLSGEAYTAYQWARSYYVLITTRSVGESQLYGILLRLQSLENRMELLGQYERYYEGLRYNGSYFRAYEQMFYGWYHLTVQKVAHMLGSTNWST